MEIQAEEEVRTRRKHEPIDEMQVKKTLMKQSSYQTPSDHNTTPFQWVDEDS